jgi:hypothetical protein
MDKTKLHFIQPHVFRSGMHRLLVINSHGSDFSNFETTTKVKASLVSPLEYVLMKAS